jgi:hypothetical protein
MKSFEAIWASIVAETARLKVKSSRGKHNERAVKKKTRFHRKHPDNVTTTRNWHVEVVRPQLLLK